MAAQYEAEKEKYLKHFEHDAQQGQTSAIEELKTTPLFTMEVKCMQSRPQDAIEGRQSEAGAVVNTSTEILPQYALLGLHIGDHSHINQPEPITLTTATPNSAFICGSQGSGKSYTLSCMLQTYLLPNSDYGSFGNPVTGIAFHYDSEGTKSIAEIASLCSRGVNVRGLVSESNYDERLQRYTELAKDDSQNMDLQVLAYKDEHLNAQRMKRLMSFSETLESGVPLYLAVIRRILRDMNGRMDAKKEWRKKQFTFAEFERRLAIEEQELHPNQKNMLYQRMDILKSFRHNPNMDKKDQATENVFKTHPNTLTIVDLTSPFMDKSTACVLFDICIELFREGAPPDGLAVVLDEAHRYMDDTAAAATFTEPLLTSIKPQRHGGTGVIIATQEPTISSKLMDLCSITIVHRFSSPAWFNAIKDHLAAASESDRQDTFEKIVKLNVGESLMFSPL